MRAASVFSLRQTLGKWKPELSFPPRTRLTLEVQTIVVVCSSVGNWATFPRQGIKIIFLISFRTDLKRNMKTMGCIALPIISRKIWIRIAFVQLALSRSSGQMARCKYPPSMGVVKIRKGVTMNTAVMAARLFKRSSRLKFILVLMYGAICFTYAKITVNILNHSINMNLFVFGCATNMCGWLGGMLTSSVGIYITVETMLKKIFKRCYLNDLKQFLILNYTSKTDIKI